MNGYVLGVKEKCTFAEAKTAWKDLAKIYHPDVNPQGDRKIKEINNAWDKAEKSFTKFTNFGIDTIHETWDAYCSEKGKEQEDFKEQFERYRQEFERKTKQHMSASVRKTPRKRRSVQRLLQRNVPQIAVRFYQKKRVNF